MRENKSLGISSGLRPLYNFTVKLKTKYETTYGSEVGKNAEIKVVAEDIKKAREIAYNKAKTELKAFPYVKQESIKIDLIKRGKTYGF